MPSRATQAQQLPQGQICTLLLRLVQAEFTGFFQKFEELIMTKNIPLALHLVFLTALSSMPASVAAENVIMTGGHNPVATVSVASLDLGTPEGVARLRSQVEAAAAELCLTNAVEPVGTRIARTKCYRAAVSSGYRQIDRMVAAKGARPATATASINTRTGG